MADPTGTYSAIVNGVEGTLSLALDGAGNLVNSTIGTTSIAGKYDDTTGKLTFTEHFKWPTPTFWAPSYVGYEMTLSEAVGQPLAFAGTLTELQLVEVSLGVFYFERVERGWWAIAILPE